jgi:DNA-binding SARP family transcriptional activator
VLDALADKLADSTDELTPVLRRRVDLDPGDENAHARLIAALAQNGAMADAEAQKQASARML